MYSKAIKKYNSNKIKINNSVLPVNEFLLNGICRTCKLKDRSCKCFRFTTNYKEMICYCGDKKCEFNCGLLECGCIDICRKHIDFNDYFFY